MCIRDRDKTNTLKLLSEELVPMSRRPFESVEGLLEAPVCVGFRYGTMWQWANDCWFIIGKDRVAECILTVSLFKSSTIAYGQCHHQMHNRLGYNRCIAVGLRPVDRVLITKHNNP